MANPNFGSVLDRESSSVERPKPMPVGTYLCVVKGQPKFDVSSKKKTEFAEFSLYVLQAAEDVDQEALAEALNGKPLAEKTIRATYYLTEDAIYRLKEFLDHLGIEETPGMTLRQRISGAPGRQVLAAIRHRPSDDGTAVYAELASTAAVEG